MLYPNLNELISYKDHKSQLRHTSKRTVKSIIPGNHHSPFRGQGLEFDSVREYVPGDDIRSIDWRVTARTGSPHLKLFREERERHVMVCVDMHAYMRFGTKKTFKSIQAARVAALLGWQGIGQHDRVSACLFGDVPDGIQFFAPSRSKSTLCSVLKRLAEPPVESHEVPLADVLQRIIQGTHTGSLIYLVSDFMNLERNLQLESLLRRLNSKGDLIFVSVNDPSDRAITPIGSLNFSNAKDGKYFVDTQNNISRANYEAQWQENRKNLYELSFRSKIPLVELSTESDVLKDLAIGLKTIAMRKRS